MTEGQVGELGVARSECDVELAFTEVIVGLASVPDMLSWVGWRADAA